MNTAPLENAAAVGAIIGLIGARLVYLIFWGGGMSLLEMLRVWDGGLSSHGGYIFGVIAAWLYLKIYKVDVLGYFDAAAPFILLGWAIGRLGCFLNWDSYGKIGDSFFSIVVLGESRFPTQLFEAAGYLIGFAVCYLCLQKFAGRLKKGGILALSLCLFAAVRFSVDFLRDDPFSYFLFSQVLTGLILLVSGIYFLRSINKKIVI